MRQSTAIAAIIVAGIALTGCGVQETPVSRDQTGQASPPTVAATPTVAAAPTGDGGDTGAASSQSGAEGDQEEGVVVSPNLAGLRIVHADDGRSFQIWVDDVSGLYALDVEIRFDAAGAQVADADPDWEGVQIQPGQAPSPDFVAINEVDNQSGVIRYVATQLGDDPGFDGSGMIATASWQSDAGQGSRAAFGAVILVSKEADAIDFTLE